MKEESRDFVGRLDGRTGWWTGGVRYVGDTSVVVELWRHCPGVLFPRKLGGGAALKRKAIPFIDVQILRHCQVEKSSKWLKSPLKTKAASIYFVLTKYFLFEELYTY